VNRMLTLLTRTGIVWPVPAAGPAPSATSCPGAITGREPPFSERGTGQVRAGRYLRQG